MKSASVARVARGAWACVFLACTASAFAASPDGDTPIRAEPEYQPYAKVEAAPKLARADASRIRNVTLAPLSAPKAAAQGHSGTPLQVGFGRDVAELSDGARTQSSLQWHTLDSGALVAAMSVTSPGAASVRAGLRVKAMPAGTLVRFYAPGGSDVSEASAEEIQENVGRSLAAGETSQAALLYWSPLVEGATLVVEIELPAGQSPAHLDLAVPEVSHLVTSPSMNFVVPTVKAGSASCENDVMCYQGTWANESNSTARILFADGGSSYLCTGTLVVDLDTSTSVPYFVTANHCINSQPAASSIQSFWFYRASACNSGVKGASVTLSGGATLLYNSATTDTSLVRLSATPPGGAVYAGWSVGSAASLGAAVTGIHHPHGDLQKISFGSLVGYTTCQASGSDSFSCNGASSSTGTFVDVQWSSGITEPGSSGSGLFLNSGHYLVGQLYGGDGTGCTDPGTDTYGRFDVAYRAGLYKYLGGTPSGGGGTGGTGTGGTTPPPSSFTPAFNYTSLWWNPAESGWGLSINQHSSAVFAAWYAYGAGGTPTWLVMPGGTWTSKTSITGDLYATSGPPSAGAYNASQVTSTKVGTATLTFSAADRGVLSYTVNGVSGTKPIQKQTFGVSDSTAVASYGDLWWNSSESGWGLSIAQQYRTLFSVLYTYGPYGGPTWYVMPGGAWNGTTYSGPLYRTNAAPGNFYGGAFNPAAVGATHVGTMSIAFSGTGSATLTYSVDGQVYTKSISREPF
jgi:lysyl endopeptidase